MQENVEKKVSGLFFVFQVIHRIYSKVISNWKIYFFLFISTFVFVFIYNKFKKPKYLAEVTLIVDESKPMSLSALSSVISSQLGADLGGGSGLLMGDNILELLKSQSITKRILLEPIDAPPGCLGNLYLQTSGLEKSFKKKNGLAESVKIDLRAMKPRTQDSVVRIIHERLFKNNLTIYRVDKKMSFVKVRATYGNQYFAKAFTDKLVVEVSDYYIKMKTAKSRIAVEKIQNRADSLYSILKGKTFSTAFNQSRSADLNPFFSDVTANVEMSARDKQIAFTVYTEVIKNLEIAKMNLSQDTPAIQIIDSSSFPLKDDKLGLIANVFFSSVIGFFISLLYFVLTYLLSTYKIVMAGKH